MESSGRRETVVLRKEVGILHIQYDELLFPGYIRLEYLVLKGSWGQSSQEELKMFRCSYGWIWILSSALILLMSVWFWEGEQTVYIELENMIEDRPSSVMRLMGLSAYMSKSCSNAEVSQSLAELFVCSNSPCNAFRASRQQMSSRCVSRQGSKVICQNPVALRRLANLSQPQTELFVRSNSPGSVFRASRKRMTSRCVSRQCRKVFRAWREQTNISLG